MRLPCGESRARFPVEVDTKTFVDVGNLLTKSVSAGLSKKSSSVHLINTIQSREQHNNTLKMHYTLELDLGPFLPDVVY